MGLAGSDPRKVGAPVRLDHQQAALNVKWAVWQRFGVLRAPRHRLNVKRDQADNNAVGVSGTQQAILTI